jgi:hypothetical protein
MDYGTDFLLIDDDIGFTPDGDIKIVSGPRTIAQDIDQELKIVKKRLIWDEEAGSTMPLFLNDTVDDNAIIAELERVTINDPRVEPASVQAEKISWGKYRISFIPLGAINPETLDFDLRRNEE